MLCVVLELVSAIRNISRHPEWGEMNGHYTWDRLEIVLTFELHSRERLMIITLEELSNSQETSTWASIPSVTETSKRNCKSSNQHQNAPLGCSDMSLHQENSKS